MIPLGSTMINKRSHLSALALVAALMIGCADSGGGSASGSTAKTEGGKPVVALVPAQSVHGPFADSD